MTDRSTITPHCSASTPVHDLRWRGAKGHRTVPVDVFHSAARRSVRTAIALILYWVVQFGPSAEANHPEVPGAAQDHPIALVGAAIHPVTGPVIRHGTLLMVDGKIAAVGARVKIPKTAERIDVRGKHVYPGWIHARTDLGLTEIGAVRASIDRAEVGQLNPNVKAQVAFHPDSELIPVARANGVLMVHTVPSGGLISGRSALMLLDGWTWEDMTLRAPVGMHVRWPRMNRLTADRGSRGGSSRGRPLERLEGAFRDARAYRSARRADPRQPVDARWEAMIPVLEGKVPLMVHADDESSIRSAVAFAARQRVRLIIVGGHDAPACAELLRREKVPVIVAGTYRLPRRRDEPYDVCYRLPARLLQAKVEFCIAGGGRFNASNARNLPYDAAAAVAYGLPREEAIKAITIRPARILGVADRVGSLEPGKDATLIVCDGDPLEITTHVERAWIQGRQVDLNSRHKRLWRKYREKYRRLQLIKE